MVGYGRPVQRGQIRGKRGGSKWKFSLTRSTFFAFEIADISWCVPEVLMGAQSTAQKENSRPLRVEFYKMQASFCLRLSKTDTHKGPFRPFFLI